MIHLYQIFHFLIVYRESWIFPRNLRLYDSKTKNSTQNKERREQFLNVSDFTSVEALSSTFPL